MSLRTSNLSTFQKQKGYKRMSFVMISKYRVEISLLSYTNQRTPTLVTALAKHAQSSTMKNISNADDCIRFFCQIEIGDVILYYERKYNVKIGKGYWRRKIDVA